MAFYIPEMTEFEQAHKTLKQTRQAWTISSLYLEHAKECGSVPAVVSEFQTMVHTSYREFLKAKGHYDTLRL